MTLTTLEKTKFIQEFQTKKGDTGSPSVQIALLTFRIQALTEHFKLHKKDNHSRRGLIGLVNERRKLLNYLKKINSLSYEKLIKRLKLRR